MRRVTRVHIGLNRWNGKLANYAKRYGLLELDGDELPPSNALRKWRRQVSKDFVFAILLPSAVATLAKGGARDDALRRARAAAFTLDAKVLVLATPPSVRPTRENIERLVDLAAVLREDGRAVAWEPSGIWSPEEVRRVVATTGWLPVVDGAEHEIPEGERVYTRLRAIGKATRLGPQRLQRLAAQLAEREEAYVIADASLGPKLLATLQAAIEHVAAEPLAARVFLPAGAEDEDLEGGLFDDEGEDEGSLDDDEGEDAGSLDDEDEDEDEDSLDDDDDDDDDDEDDAS